VNISMNGCRQRQFSVLTGYFFRIFTGINANSSNPIRL